MWCPSYPERLRSLLTPNVVFEVSHFLSKTLDSVALSVTDIHQAVIADNHTMHNLHERTAHTCVCLFFCPLVTPPDEGISRTDRRQPMRLLP